MQKFSVFLAFLLFNLAAGTFIPRAPAGTQFITGPCQSDADCASGCCGFNTGKCAGPVVAQERDGGCGFGDAQPNDNAAVAFRNGQDPDAAGAAGASGSGNSSSGDGSASAGTGTGNASGDSNTGATQTSPAQSPAGTQFITGTCSSDADCASGCCGFNTGKCAGPVVAQERDGGCGFGDAQPNDNAAVAFRNGQDPGAAGAAGSSGSGSNNTSGNTSGSAGTGNGNTGSGSQTSTGQSPAGTQFITGTCSSDADCASSCCGFNSGKCAGPIVAQERDGGCGFGDAQPNDNAAQALRGQR